MILNWWSWTNLHCLTNVNEACLGSLAFQGTIICIGNQWQRTSGIWFPPASVGTGMCGAPRIVFKFMKTSQLVSYFILTFKQVTPLPILFIQGNNSSTPRAEQRWVYMNFVTDCFSYFFLCVFLLQCGSEFICIFCLWALLIVLL